VQVTMEDLAFEASDDIVDGGGRFVQPGVFTLQVEGLTQEVELVGNPLKVEDWVVLRQGTFTSNSIPSLLY
jgi:hypothetical protein